LLSSRAQNQGDLWNELLSKKKQSLINIDIFISLILSHDINFAIVRICIYILKQKRVLHNWRLRCVCKYQFKPAAFLKISYVEQLHNCLLNFQFSFAETSLWRFLSLIPHPYFMNWKWSNEKYSYKICRWSLKSLETLVINEQSASDGFLLKQYKQSGSVLLESLKLVKFHTFIKFS
jgi:magnesium-transporting ATPase (P-type)